MGLIDRVVRKFTPQGAFDPAPIAGELNLRAFAGDLPGRPWTGPRTANWNSTDTSALIRDAWRKLSVVFACATLLGDAVAESPMRVYRRVDGEPQADENHPLQALLDDPNPRFSGAEFWALAVDTMAVTGYVVLEKIRSSDGLPVELWQLRTSYLTVKPRENGPPAWEYKVPGNPKRVLEPEEVVVITFRDDVELGYLGISPLSVLAREVGIDNSLTDFLKGLLDHGGVPPFVLEHPDELLDPAIVESIQETWAQKYGGGKNWHKLPVFHGGFKVAKVGLDLNEMAWPDLRGMNELRICQAYRIPPHLVFAREALRNGGLSTTEQEQAMRMIQLYAATPLRNRIDGAITRAVLREFTSDPTYSVEFDTGEIKALQEDENKLHERVRMNVGAGIITRAEARRVLDLPIRAADNVYLIPFNVVEVPAGEEKPEERKRPAIVREVKPPALPSGRRYRDTRALSPVQLERRASAVAGSRKLQQKYTQILDRAMRKFFTEQGKRIAEIAARSRYLQSETSDIVTGFAETPFGVQVRDIAQINWDDEEDLLREVLDKFYSSATEAAFKATNDLLGTEIPYDGSDPNISRVLRQLGERVVDINDETRRIVQDVVGDALTEPGGVTLDELAARIKEQFGEASKARAMTIARTESQVCLNRANVLSYAETGEVDEVELDDNPEHTTDPGSDGLTCAERHGLIVKLGDVQQHIDAEHPNGSLATIPILRDELGAD